MTFTHTIKSLSLIAVLAMVFTYSVNSTFAQDHNTETINNSEELAAQLVAELLKLELEKIVDTQEVVEDTPTVSGLGDSCRNTQITSFTPMSNSKNTILEEFEFTTTNDVYLPSLETTINGKTYPVQYKEQADGTFVARVVNLDEIKGYVYVSLGAGSQEPNACNDLLHTSFSVADTQSNVVNNPVYGGVTNSETKSVIAATKQNNSSVAIKEVIEQSNLFEEEVVVGVETDKKQLSTSSQELVVNEEAGKSKGFFAWVAGLFTGSPKDDKGNVSDNVVVDNDTIEPTIALVEEVATSTATTATQLAQLSASIQENDAKCSTVGAAWSWYVYLAVIWLWLIAVWVLISYYAEPAFGTAQYARRLVTVVAGAGIVGVMLWYLTNPCFTHAWLPATFIGLSVILHWLYSEDTHSA